jgi:DNA-binding SARP family transcriptional activator/TolB-like protein
MIELRALGSAELKGTDGVALRAILAQPKRFALLAYLAVHHSQGPRRRDAVIALFWPELDSEHARGSLRQALRFLRRTLGEGVLNGRSEEELGLEDGTIWCDAEALEQACAVKCWAQALELYRGDFFDGFFVSRASPELDHWIGEERARFRRMACEAARAFAHRCETDGDAARAVHWTRRALGLFPHDEQMLRQLIALLDRLGDRVAAVQVYEEFARRVARDYNLLPAAETQALVDVVRSRATVGTGSARTRLGMGIDPGLTGRDPVRVESRAPIRTGATIAAAALLALGGYLIASRAQRTPVLDPMRVVVEPFDNETGDSSLAPLGRMAADWITQGFMQTGLVQVVPASTVLLATEGRAGSATGQGLARAQVLARETAAGLVVSGTYYRTGDSVRFQAQIVDGATGRLLQAVQPVSAGVRDPVLGIEVVRQRVTGGLAPLLDAKLSSWAASQSHPPSFEAYQEFIAGREIMSRDRDARGALPHLYRAAASDSSYVVPLLWAIAAHLRLGERAQAESVARVLELSRANLAPLDRYVLDRHEAELAGDLAGALRASRQLVALAPRSQFVYWVAFDAGALNRPREAVEALQQLDPTLPWVKNWQEYWVRLAYNLHILGDYRRELAVARRARQQRPELLRYLWLEVQALAGLGRIDEVRMRLDESLTLPFGQAQDPGVAWVPGEVMRNAALELRAHGYRQAAQEALDRANAWYAARPREEKTRVAERYHLLQRVYEAGRWNQAAAVAASLLTTDSADLGYRGFWAQAAAHRGDRQTAARASAWFAHVKDPSLHGDQDYIRAQIAAVLGQREDAVRLLRQAYAKGFAHNYYDHLQEDFEGLLDYPPYRALMLPKG